MASTELSLNRTLSDALEDQLYDLNPDQTVFYPSFFAQNQRDLNESASKNKSVTEIPLSCLLDESLLTGNQVSNYTQHQHFQQPIHNTIWNSNSRKTLENLTSSPSKKIFSKYADPTLTTTTMVSKSNNGSPSYSYEASKPNTPAPSTISLNKVMKVPNQLTAPINNVSISTPQIPMQSMHDVKITNNFNDDLEGGFTSQINDEFEEQYFTKSTWPLQDNNMALNMNDARMIFDDEFVDDLSEDEDEDEHMVDDIVIEAKETGNNFIDSSSKQIIPTIDTTFNNQSFVDSDLSNNKLSNPLYGNSYSQECALLDDIDTESNMIDDDDLYELSFKRRKESVVFNKDVEKNISITKKNDTHSNTRKIELNIPITKKKIDQIDNFKTSHTEIEFSGKVNTRKKDSITINSSTEVPSVTNTTFKKKNTDTKKQNIASNQGNEIFKCMIMNIVTNKPCSAEFSRSYDLTRHQNTIHAKRKIVFRCSECIRSLGNEGFQKTFSRLDALSRHIKSKHENLSIKERQEVTKYAKQNVGYAVG
ncbi:hypothetical protein Kpol_1037p4 [Vanderwaltozyma polyspora DSM 70294]|uniref:C2H2-type domain-containing protein n=1 Tax=Vanderwaltozyma polyspora (strain ATCC 22028 / DSM 70294 / BCRC 21397 / CBS 2163 / NBRC 10782 / NRRL Y-8283 / UCD 57-17) TaxID=436907 RepID=A7TJU6_VANPO|nr:uncharacterized protein Kpol_1037p4 [Vanderwaltozyma polyspora DSM 70294]EDO17408.1 hypothetical protein Kpol_1037p4 [Vanderwaltozyma polyspora DSM 70294]